MTISFKEYFKVNDYKTIDSDGGDYNDLTSDLTSLDQTFETVFNPGTIEHIWTPHAAWSNALKLVKVGGYFVGVVLCMDIGDMAYTSTTSCNYNLIKKNGFELLDPIQVAKKAGPAIILQTQTKANGQLTMYYFGMRLKKLNTKTKLNPVTQIWDSGTNTIDSK